MKRLNSLLLLILSVAFISSCSDDDGDNTPTQAVTGTIVQPGVGGPTQPNQVYFDFSSQMQSNLGRASWHLGFYSGAENRVVLNPSIEMLAYATTEDDITAVNATDTMGLAEKLSLDAIFTSITSPMQPAWLADAINWVDNPNGDLTETAIDEVMAVTTDNKVYIINSGKDANGMEGVWYKIKVDQEPNGYSLQVALIDDMNATTYSISKEADYNFAFFSFTDGLVTIEPKKTDWDIAFTTFTDYANFGFNVPYFYQDYVIQNRTGVEVVQLTFNTSEEMIAAYEAFTINGTSGMNFDSDMNIIGSNWREVATPQPGTVTGVLSDRMFIVKDAIGDYYKVVFTDMLSNGGERGYPEFVFTKL
ncbi:MAG: hypothetical protein HKN75_09100 [Bacteroidia bacterium]|nr:hypothetical protein [Bacteroidia bacterium]